MARNLLHTGPVPEHAYGVKAEARVFAEEHIKPVREEYRETGEYPWDVLEAGQEAGLVGQDIGEVYGGRGLDRYEKLAMLEEFFRVDPGIGLTLQLASFGTEMLEMYGTEEQKEDWLRPVAEGEMITGLAATEPQGGSDLAGMETEAVLEDDGWRLNGEKYWTSNGVAADWITLYAKTGDRENPHKNYSLFILPTDREGVYSEEVPEKIGMQASQQAHLVLDDVKLPDEYLIGEEGEGFYILAEFFNEARVNAAGHGVGIGAAAIEEAWDFVHAREAFDQPIGDFQTVQHTLADMHTEYEAARELVWAAAGDEEPPRSSMAKVKATEMAVDVTGDAMELHGGRSMLDGERVSQLFRDARAPVVYEGANAVQREVIYRFAGHD